MQQTQQDCDFSFLFDDGDDTTVVDRDGSKNTGERDQTRRTVQDTPAAATVVVDSVAAGVPRDVVLDAFSRTRLVRVHAPLRRGASKESRLALVSCTLFHVVDVRRRAAVHVTQQCVVKASATRRHHDGWRGGGGGTAEGPSVFLPASDIDAGFAIVAQWMLTKRLTPFYPCIYDCRTVVSTTTTTKPPPAQEAAQRHNVVTMQQLDGTLEELLKNGFFQSKTLSSSSSSSSSPSLKWSRVGALMAQVVFGVAQGYAVARLVHNDFHAANVMYERVARDSWLYYCYDDMYFCVPTYGVVYKQIDWGRASFVCPDDGGGGGNGNRVLVSDFWDTSFARKHSLSACRPATDLIRFIYEIEHLFDAEHAESSGNAADAAYQLVHRLTYECTRVSGGGTIRSRLAAMGLDGDYETLVRAHVWVPMIDDTTATAAATFRRDTNTSTATAAAAAAPQNPCVCKSPAQYIALFYDAYGIDEAAVPGDATVYRIASARHNDAGMAYS